MRILFVTPINRSYVVMPSLGLGYLASVARTRGHQPFIVNCMREQWSYADFSKYIRANRFDIIGFQVFSYDINSVKKHVEIIKENSPESIIVAGGAHPSGDPEGIMKYIPGIDYSFMGEAEIGFSIFLDSIGGDVTEVPGLIWRENGIIRANEPVFVNDLDSIPMPAWDIIKPEGYPEAPHGAFARQFPSAPIIVTRGCPFPCTFCAGKSITGNRVRYRSVDNVMEELRYLRKRGIKEFHVEDENFTGRKALVMEFCERLLRENLGMTWSLPAGVRIDCIDREMLEMMQKAGCYSMALGIEFGSQRMHDLTKKKLKIEQIREKLNLFKGLKIKTTGFFLFAIPGETIQDMKETIKFALELPLDRAQFNNFMPLPGSHLWEELKAKGKLKDIEWDRFFVHDVAYADEGMKRTVIKKMQRMAYLRFYLRPRIIYSIIKEIRSLRHLKFLFKRLIDALR